MILLLDAPLGMLIYTGAYALICAAICLRVLLFERRGGDYRALPAWLAWGVAVASGSVPLRLVVGGLPVPDPATVVLAAFLLCAVLRSRGSVQHLLPQRRGTPAPARQTTRQELI